MASLVHTQQYVADTTVTVCTRGVLSLSRCLRWWVGPEPTPALPSLCGTHGHGGYRILPTKFLVGGLLRLAPYFHEELSGVDKVRPQETLRIGFICEKSESILFVKFPQLRLWGLWPYRGFGGDVFDVGDLRNQFLMFIQEERRERSKINMKTIHSYLLCWVPNGGGRMGTLFP